MLREGKMTKMKDDFKKDASESLLRFHSILLKKANRIRWRLPKENFNAVTQYLNQLQIVASDVDTHCNPQIFNKTMQKIGFDVQTNFSLFNLNEYWAQSVYDILICVRDYMCWVNGQFRGTGKFTAYRYKSTEEAIEAMRTFKSDAFAEDAKVLSSVVQWLRQSVKEQFEIPVK